MRIAEHEEPTCGNKDAQSPPMGSEATRDWQCQRFLASGELLPLKIGSARENWRAASSRHSALALPVISGKSHSELAVPGIFGVAELFAIQCWHCQELLARNGFSPLSIGTANDWWRPRPSCHPALALPVIFGVAELLATQLWHCQRFLAQRALTAASKHEKSSLAGAFKFIWWTVGGSNPGPWD